MRTIKLTSGKITCLDDEDYHRFGLLVWHADKDGYARRNVKDVHGINHAVYLHRLIVGALSGQKVDHVNRCKWDNSRINLRIVTSSENSQNYPIPKTNTSGFVGVVRLKAGKWQAQIRAGKNKRLYLGVFDSPEEAAKTYDQNKIKHHGPFGVFNCTVPK